MKKNITINLAGQLFAIDVDAYDLLFNYTETLRRYYRRQPEGEEVVDDIEARIAELFGELKAQGFNAITIEHVQDVIKRIGNLEELTGSAQSADGGTSRGDEAAGPGNSAQGAAEGARRVWSDMRAGKRFYRDTENKMVAGVLAGLARYFGGDVVIWRVVFLILMFAPIPFLSNHGLSGFFFVSYIILAIIAPAASTPEERLKMRGEAVNPQNLADEVSRENDATTANAARAQRRHAFSIVCAVLLVLFSVWIWLGFIGGLCGAGAIVAVPNFMGDEIFGATSAPAEAVKGVLWSVLYFFGAVELLLFTLGYCSMHTGLALFGKVKAMGLKERLAWLSACIASIVCITVTGVNCASEVEAFRKAYPEAAHCVDVEIASPIGVDVHVNTSDDAAAAGSDTISSSSATASPAAKSDAAAEQGSKADSTMGKDAAPAEAGK